MKMAEINRCLRKKNLYTAQQIRSELSAVKEVEIYILDAKHFYDWETLLNKFFKDMPVGFTKYYCFELSDGQVTMKRLSDDTPEAGIETKVIVENFEATRIAFLDELFCLPPDSSLTDIVNSKHRLAKLMVKPISDKRFMLSISGTIQMGMNSLMVLVMKLQLLSRLL